jgi:AraC family transcriptional regulator
MYRTAFPDLAWLRRTITERWQLGAGWPSVVLHVRGPAEHRPDIRGPLSVFLNRAGSCHVTADGYRAHVVPGTFFVTNPEQPYTLDVPGPATETFNLHFGEDIAEIAFRDLTTSADRLLEVAPDDAPRAGANWFAQQLYPLDGAFAAAVERVYANRLFLNADSLRHDELLIGLLPPLLAHQADVLVQIARLPAARVATRRETYRRLRRAVDYLYAHFADDTLTLQTLATVACLSKFHFVRLFSLSLGCSPFAFRQQLRLRHAQYLLATTERSVGDVAHWVGFGSDAAFCRAFFRLTGVWPQAWRAANAAG